MSSKRVQYRVQDIADNIIRIDGYVSGMDLAAFQQSRVVVDACERCLQRITEAAIKIGEEAMSDIAPEIPFHTLRGFGNVLRHDYDGIDDQLIYDTIMGDLPKLKSACEGYLANL